MQIQNKIQTSRKSYTFLKKACARREHANGNNDNNNDNNNKRKIFIYIYKKRVNISLRYKGIQ